MLELIRLQPQDNFPEYDITPNNAVILKQMLCDPGIRQYAHETAENSMTLYRMSHIALREVINTESVFGTDGGTWFNHGIVQYEDLVSSQYMAALLKAKDQDNYFDKAHTSFVNEQPVFCEVIEAVTKQAHGAKPMLVEHAIFGAAVQRQVELDAKSNFETEQELQTFLSSGLDL